jgi:hypothetical protein
MTTTALKLTLKLTARLIESHVAAALTAVAVAAVAVAIGADRDTAILTMSVVSGLVGFGVLIR